MNWFEMNLNCFGFVCFWAWILHTEMRNMNWAEGTWPLYTKPRRQCFNRKTDGRRRGDAGQAHFCPTCSGRRGKYDAGVVHRGWGDQGN